MFINGRCCFSLAVVLLISLEINADQRQKVLDFHSECLDAHGVDEGVLIEALDGSVRQDEDFYRHIFCAARKAKLMSEDGTVHTENFEIDMKDVIDPQNMANVASIIRKCLVQKSDIMTTVSEAVHCFMAEEHGL